MTTTTTPTLTIPDLTFEVYGSGGTAAISGRTGGAVGGYDLLNIEPSRLPGADEVTTEPNLGGVGGPLADSTFPSSVDGKFVQPIYDVIGAVIDGTPPGDYPGAASLQFLLEARDNLDKAIRAYPA